MHILPCHSSGLFLFLSAQLISTKPQKCGVLLPSPFFMDSMGILKQNRYFPYEWIRMYRVYFPNKITDKHSY